MDPNLGLADAQTLVCNAINDFRDGALLWFTYNSIEWDSDVPSVVNILGTLQLAQLLGGALPAGFQWRDYNNVNHTMTLTDMEGLAAACGIYINSVYGASWQHKANVLALTDSVSVQTYDYTDTLWPSQTTG